MWIDKNEVNITNITTIDPKLIYICLNVCQDCLCDELKCTNCLDDGK